MEPISRHVRDIDTPERRWLEHVIGRELGEDQKVVIRVVTLRPKATERRAKAAAKRGLLPDWCDVYAGLTPRQIASVEKTILQRADLTRPS